MHRIVINYSGDVMEFLVETALHGGAVARSPSIRYNPRKRADLLPVSHCRNICRNFKED
jgi:hypothetical protein